MKKTTLTSVVLGSSLAMAAFSGALQANENPFSATSLSSGYLVASNDKMPEGKCGGDMKEKAGKSMDGKCGGDMKEKAGKSMDGKCGGDMKEKAEKKMDGKCGEGKCGGDK
tara:strand:+ start:12498 stop:12830 length:333 start_codon:yes stop_codon:yes gene_type:complete